MATQSRIPAWRIPWTEEPGGYGPWGHMVLVITEGTWLTSLISHLPKLCLGFPCGSAGKESACKVGDPGLIPGSGTSTGEEIGHTLQYSWASFVA